MFSKLILCASPNRLVVGHWRFGKLADCEVFGSDSDGREMFRQYLHAHSATPAYLIANVAEEDYRVETTPHAIGTARKELLARKLGQIYRTSQYRAAQFLGRERDQRKDDRFLLMALTNADNVTPWVKILEEQQVVLAGVYLLPVLTQQLIATWKIKAPDVLMISRQNKGVRQTYFQNGKLRISRLTPIPGIDSAEGTALAELFLSEAEKTRAYLTSQRMIERSTNLQFVSYGADDETCRQIMAEPRGFDCAVFSRSEIAKRFGLSLAQLEKCPELTHMHALAQHTPEADLAPPTQTRAFALQQWRNLINLASAIILLASVGLSYSYWRQTGENDSQRELAMQQTAKQSADYEQVAKNFPKTPLTADELRNVVEMSQKLTGAAKTPERLMWVVGTALDEMAEIQLNSLHWKLTDNPNVMDDDKDGQAAAVPSTTTSAAPINSTGGLVEVGFVGGEIRNFRGDYRAAVASVDKLAEQIRKNEMVDQVLVEMQPINASSLITLQGSTQEGGAQQAAKALFKLRVVLKPENKA